MLCRYWFCRISTCIESSSVVHFVFMTETYILYMYCAMCDSYEIDFCVCVIFPGLENHRLIVLCILYHISIDEKSRSMFAYTDCVPQVSQHSV